MKKIFLYKLLLIIFTVSTFASVQYTRDKNCDNSPGDQPGCKGKGKSCGKPRPPVDPPDDPDDSPDDNPDDGPGDGPGGGPGDGPRPGDGPGDSPDKRGDYNPDKTRGNDNNSNERKKRLKRKRNSSRSHGPSRRGLEFKSHDTPADNSGDNGTCTDRKNITQLYPSNLSDYAYSKLFKQTGSPVFLAKGSFFQSQTDLEIYPAKMSLKVFREYSHKEEGYGPFGNSWTFNHHIYLFEAKTSKSLDMVYIFLGNRKISFVFKNGKYINISGGGEALSKVNNMIWTLTTTTKKVYAFQRIKTQKNYSFLTTVTGLKNRLIYHYDDFNRLEQIEDEASTKTLNISYNDKSLISEIIDSYGRKVSYFYNEFNNLSQVIDPLGYAQIYQYEDLINPLLLTSYYNKNGLKQIGAKYSEEGELISFEEYGEEVLVNFGDNQITETFPNGQIATTSIGPDDMITSQVKNGLVFQNNIYDHNRKLVYESDGLLSHKAYRYNSHGKVIETKKLFGRVKAIVPTDEDYFNNTESIVKIESVTETISLTFFNDQTQSVEAYYATTETTKEVEFEQYIIRSSDPDTKKCEAKGALEYLDKKTIEGLIYSRGLIKKLIPKPYYIDTTDEDGCIYLNPVDLPGDSWKNIYTVSYKTIRTGGWKSCDYSEFFGQFCTTYPSYTINIPISRQMGRIEYPDGSIKSYVYHPDGRVKTITSPTGVVTRFSYNNRGQLTHKYDKFNNLLVYYEYDPITFNKIAKTNPLGNRKTWLYDENDNVIEKSDYKGNITKYTYDIYNRVLSITSPPNENGNMSTESFTYDGEGNVKTYTDSLGNVTTFNYDASNRKIKVIYADGLTSHVIYNGKNLVKILDRVGSKVDIKYNFLDNVTEIKNNIGNKYTFESDRYGNVLKSISPVGDITTFTYNNNYQVSKVSGPNNTFTNIDHDFNNNVVKVSSSNGLTVTNAYLASRLLLKSVVSGNSQSRITSYQYNDLGRLFKVIDPSGNSAEITYDVGGRVVEVKDAANNIVKTVYDENNVPIEFKNEKGHSWSNTLNNLSQQISGTTPLANQSQYEYNLNGLLTKSVSPEGNYKVFEYNVLNQVKKVNYFNVDSILQESIDLLYDLNSNLIEISSTNQSVILSYDTLNQLISKKVPVLNRELIYEYNELGLRSSMMILNTLSNEFELTQYEYNVHRQLTWLNQNGNVTNFYYNNKQLIDHIVYPDGTIKEYTYDDLNQLTELKFTYDTSVLNYFAYTYDLNGNKLTETTPNGLTLYEYNNLNKLITVTYPDGVQESFEYDIAGNRTKWSRDGIITDYTYNEENQLITSDEWSLNYDKNGSLISKTNLATSTSTTYNYNYNNKLSSVGFSDNTSTSYNYLPASDLRLSSTDKSGLVSFVLYDQANELEIFSEDKESILTLTNVPGLYDARLYSKNSDANGLNIFLSDSLSSIRGYKVSSSTHLDEISYYAYGAIKSGTADSISNFSYTGRISDKDTGLHYYRGRYYDSDLGVFTQVDPLRDGTNWYAYTNGNPINYNDPTGHSALLGLAGAGALVGIINEYFNGNGDYVSGAVIGAGAGLAGGAVAAGVAGGLALFVTAKTGALAATAISAASGAVGGITQGVLFRGANNARNDKSVFDQSIYSVAIDGALGGLVWGTHAYGALKRTKVFDNEAASQAIYNATGEFLGAKSATEYILENMVSQTWNAFRNTLISDGLDPVRELITNTLCGN